ncbi:oxaloacetate decarboxylase gamma chain [Halieaceae bacterium IMCC14734]|uniref:Probable oxaloacetate decarboxylase gamma chain n=2 Tax=Candidatus Litorirhabdus singularis TaxID=2518993 RepID=A0ABT3TFE7_9GAMM|nr:oxaloacetate decarboxylase gamma chain [Candidatus Litorirhabdus singularis]
MSQGLELMLFGMGTVVIFLTLLVLITTVMSALVARFPPSPADTLAAPLPVSATTSVTDPVLLSVISAAIHHHRKGR